MKLFLSLLALAGAGSGLTRTTPGHPAAFVRDSIYKLAVNPAEFGDDPVVWLLDEGVYRIEADGRTSHTTRQVVQILKP